MPHRRRRPLLLTTPVVLLAMAWLAWAAAARHRLAAARATLTAAGEPVDVTGLLGPPVPPDRNAADLYLPAARALVPNVYGPSSSNVLFPSVPPLFPPAWMAMAGPAAAANAPAFALVRQARARPDADWHVVPGKPLLQTLLPHLNDSRELANELADAALVSHLRGDDAEAVERVRDLLAMADAVDRSRLPTLVAHLVSVGEQALALSRLQVIVTDARIGTGPGAIPRPAVEDLVRQLADDARPRGRLRNAVRGEWVMAADTVRWLGSRSTVLRPLADLELARSLTDAAALSAAADRTGLSPATAVVVATKPVISPLLGRDPTAGRYGHLFTDAVGLSLGTSTRFLTTDFRCRAERRATAALLALRLYHLDHGRWPAALAELVPAYLPAVPLDPLVGGNRPIGYLVQPRALPGGRDRVLVDWNGSATGPAGTPPAYPSSSYTDSYRGGIHWRDADGWAGPLATPPATHSKPG